MASSIRLLSRDSTRQAEDVSRMQQPRHVERKLMILPLLRTGCIRDILLEDLSCFKCHSSLGNRPNCSSHDTLLCRCCRFRVPFIV